MNTRGGVVCLSFLFMPCVLAGQTSAPSPSPSPPATEQTRETAAHEVSFPWSFGIWAAAGVNQRLHTRVGQRHNRALYLGGIRMTRPFAVRPRVVFLYTFDIVPVAITTEMPAYTRIYSTQDQTRPPAATLIPSYHRAYGAGVVPLGLRMDVGTSKYVRFSTGLGCGALRFTRRIPDPEGTRFNFALEGMVGLKVLTPIGRITFGGSFHHISNAGFGNVNPGMNTWLGSLSYDR